MAHFLIDAQLPRSLCDFFVRRGHSATHLCDVLPPQATDEEVARMARASGWVVVSKDVDMTVIARRRGGFTVLWLRLGNVGNQALGERLGSVWPKIEATLPAGEVIIEVR